MTSKNKDSEHVTQKIIDIYNEKVQMEPLVFDEVVENIIIERGESPTKDNGNETWTVQRGKDGQMQTTEKKSRNSPSTTNTARRPGPISPSGARVNSPSTTTNVIRAAARMRINAKPEEEKKSTQHVRNKSTP